MFQHGGTLKASARADAERGASNPARPVRHQSVCYTPPRMYHVRQSRSEFFQTESERRSPAMSTAAVETRDTGGLGGHPRGLTTLFFTEMWERFSYYGMRAILFLYMTAELNKGGLGWKESDAGPIFGLYASSVYFLPLIGGWLADRFIGAKRATFIGGVIIMLGHFSLAVPTMKTFCLGLVLVAVGTGFLKSTISAMVGDLVDEQDVRRDAGVSILYVGIDIGAFAAPLVTGFLAQSDAFRSFVTRMGLDPNSSWHFGFAAAGVGMAFRSEERRVGK